MTAVDSHRALRTLLLILAILFMAGGLAVVFWTSGIVSMIPVEPQLAVSLLSLLILKALGVFVIAFGYLALRASRDPVRNVAVIDAIIFVALGLAALDLWAVTTQNFGAVVPAHLIWLREAVRVTLAVVLFVLRPRRSGAVARDA